MHGCSSWRCLYCLIFSFCILCSGLIYHSEFCRLILNLRMVSISWVTKRNQQRNGKRSWRSNLGELKKTKERERLHLFLQRLEYLPFLSIVAIFLLLHSSWLKHSSLFVAGEHCRSIWIWQECHWQQWDSWYSKVIKGNLLLFCALLYQWLYW